VLPYAQAHGWEASRYAGVFPLLLVLVSQWQWLARLMGMLQHEHVVRVHGYVLESAPLLLVMEQYEKGSLLS
jgi:hypothetical protein